MFIIIAGASRTGSRLAQLLMEKNHTVHLIEDRANVLAKVHRELPTEIIHEGSPIDPVVLERAGVKKADMVAAVTVDDEVNLALCYMARQRYQVPRTIARVNDPRASWLFNDLFHVDMAVNHTEIMAHFIEEEMSLADMTSLFRLKRCNFMLMEEQVAPGSAVTDKAVRDLDLPKGCVLAGVVREGSLIVPHGDTVLLEGDGVLAVADAESLVALKQLLSGDDAR